MSPPQRSTIASTVNCSSVKRIGAENFLDQVGSTLVAALVLVGALGACSTGKSEFTRPASTRSGTDRSGCATGVARKVAPFVGPVVGKGPVYAGAVGAATVQVEYPPSPRSGFAGSDWTGAKILWVVAPAYKGPIRIRGHQVHGTEILRFGGARFPVAVLRLSGEGARAPGQRDWRGFPSYVRLRAVGCYALQIEGDGFSQKILLRASLV